MEEPRVGFTCSGGASRVHKARAGHPWALSLLCQVEGAGQKGEVLAESPCVGHSELAVMEIESSSVGARHEAGQGMGLIIRVMTTGDSNGCSTL